MDSYPADQRRNRRILFPIVKKSIGIQVVIAEKHKRPPAKSVRAAARSQIDAPARSSTVFGGKLIRDYLNFRDSFQRRLKTDICRTVVIIIQTVNRDVV